ncbi:MAG: hypothetical protein ACPF9D_07390, partial [Owenweeksia sp.]
MKYSLLCLSLIFFLPSHAQTTVAVNNLSLPVGLAVNNNDLYICQFGAGTISKIDLSQPIPIMASTTTDFVTGLTSPTRMLLIGQEIYFSELQNGKISKIDLSVSP